MSEAAHYSRYRLGELPVWALCFEDGSACVDIPSLGRVGLREDDRIAYDADWNPIGVIRRAVWESTFGDRRN